MDTKLGMDTLTSQFLIRYWNLIIPVYYGAEILDNSYYIVVTKVMV